MFDVGGLFISVEVAGAVDFEDAKSVDSVTRVDRLMQLRSHWLVRERWILNKFLGFLLVRVVAHCFGKSGQEVLAHSCALSLALEAAVDEPQLLLSADLGVAAVLSASRAHLNTEL